MYSPKAIANAFLDMATTADQKLTQMKLHKLIYYTHGWHLGIIGSPLIDETIEAWKYGPVVRSLYYEFRDVGAKPIERKASEFDFSGGSFEIEMPSVPKSDTATWALLNKVWKVYGGLTAGQLSSMTHEPDSPWTKTWNEAQADGVIKGRDIPNPLIKEYFQRKAQENRDRTSR